MNDEPVLVARRAVGAMLLTIFGAVWLMIWSQRSFGFWPGLLFLIVCATVASLVRAIRQYRDHGSAPVIADKRAFAIVNITLWVAILVVGKVGLKDWAIPAAILIIGIHLFPLAKALGNPRLNWTGASMAVLAIGYPLVAAGGPANTIGCLGSGVILWASAFWSLAGGKDNEK